MTDKHLFIFNLGPVQSFIAEARRTRDLFVGSRLLVELTRAAAKAVDSIDNMEWVYPSSVDQDSLPNRFVAFVPVGQMDQACRAAEDAVKDIWKNYADHARAKLAEFAPREDEIWEEIWKRQITTFPEVYWAVCAPPSPDEVARLLGNAERGYSAHYTIASLALNARKGMRQFGQTTERGEKDTLNVIKLADGFVSHGKPLGLDSLLARV